MKSSPTEQEPEAPAKMIEAVCECCDKAFSYEPWIPGGARSHVPSKCDECIASAAEERWKIEEERREAERMMLAARTWKDIAPPRFQETDITSPLSRQGLYKAAMAWGPTPEQPWLGIVGEKGACKTRVALLRLQKQIEERPDLNYAFVPVYDFATAVQRQYLDEGGKYAREYLRDARGASWLILDDLGKAKATPAVVAALFALLDHRHAYNLTTIWTGNSTPEEICEGMADDVGEPLVRRLKEVSKLLQPRKAS